MKCEAAREQLTAYLDGELDGDLGSAIRGHLRTCQACRDVARDEAALRDGLRSLPPVDPPASLWAGVQARLAAAEMADAEQPAWRRTLARWRRALATPRIGFGALAMAIAIVVLVLRNGQLAHHEPLPAITKEHPSPVIAPEQHVQPFVKAAKDLDVTDDIAQEADRMSADYAATADELMRHADEARKLWSDERKATFDARVAELRAQITAAEGRKRHKVYRELIRYLQGAAIRDEVAMSERFLVRGAP